MYNYRYKDYRNLGQNTPIANIPMGNIPMENMPMGNIPMENMPMENMPMMNMPMMHMPMMCMPMMCMPMIDMSMYDDEDDDDDDEDLKSMYPKIYMMIHPMVKHHCDMMESMHGAMYCPSKEEMDHICKEVYDMYEKHHKDER